MPASRLQRGMFLLVPCHIPLEFLPPELHVGFGHRGRLAPFVTVPEASIDEDDRVPLGEHDVGMTRKLG